MCFLLFVVEGGADHGSSRRRQLTNSPPPVPSSPEPRVPSGRRALVAQERVGPRGSAGSRSEPARHLVRSGRRTTKREWFLSFRAEVDAAVNSLGCAS